MNDESIGQAALYVEMAVLVQGYPPRDGMTHRSTSDAVKDLLGQELASRLRAWRVLQLLHTSRREDWWKERIPDARNWIESHAFIVREWVIGVLKVFGFRWWYSCQPRAPVLM